MVSTLRIPSIQPVTQALLHIPTVALSLPDLDLSDPETREPFRHISYVGMAAVDCVKGLGAKSYEVALERAAAL